MRVGIVGVSGFVGSELLRLLAHHPEMEVSLVAGSSSVGKSVGDLHPALAPTYANLVVQPVEAELLRGLDVVFLAVPHGEAAAMAGNLFGEVGVLVDCSADFRLRSPGEYEKWYSMTHPRPDLLEEAVYGLVELERERIEGARLVAVPGCYPTAACLVLKPLVDAGLCKKEVVVDAVSGVSGAGRTVREDTAFWALDGDFRAYGLLRHRHTPEIEMVTGARVLFTPHLAPMTRGILVTCYAPLAAPVERTAPQEVLRSAYEDEPFVVMTGENSPSTKATFGSNTVHMTAFADERTGNLLALAALDNLVKGAAGQAVQCANVATGIEETLGLPREGTAP